MFERHPERPADSGQTHRGALVYRLGQEAGMFSEINNMILAMDFCRAQNLSFRLYSAHACYSRDGWRDYFEPFAPGPKGLAFIHRWYNRRSEAERPTSLLGSRLRNWMFFGQNTLHDSWLRIRAYRTVIHENEETQARFLDWARHVIDSIFIFNAPVSQRVGALIDGLNLPSRLIGFHIRAGDKATEAPLVDPSKYLEFARQLGWPLDDVYVSTDDYRIVEALRKMRPGIRFHSLSDPGTQGYDHTTFTSQNHQARFEYNVRFLAEIAILRRVDLFAGSYTTNPSVFLGMARAPGTSFDVTGAPWRLW